LHRPIESTRILVHIPAQHYMDENGGYSGLELFHPSINFSTS